jgi:hypothetical protein
MIGFFLNWACFFAAIVIIGDKGITYQMWNYWAVLGVMLVMATINYIEGCRR